MSDLAFTLNGDPFEVPPNAIGWRVRRMKAKGAPEVVYGRNGQPLVLPLEADIDDVRVEVATPGRYRFDPVDEGNRPIEGAPAGYGYVHDAAATAHSPVAPSASHAPSDNIVIEALRMNAEIAKSVVDRFPLMLEAAATLLRAADGAGLPARVREQVELIDDEDDDDTDDTPASSGGIDLLNNLVAQIVPLVLTGLTSKKMPKLDAILDWRRATPKSIKEPAETDALPPIDPKQMAHMMAILAALTPEEAARARQLGAELSPVELRAWFKDLAALSVPEALVKIRATIGGAS